MKGTTLAGVVLVVVIIGLIINRALGVGFILLALIAAGFYFGRPKCGYCGARGQIRQTGSEVVKQEPAYGVVTRTDTITKNKQRSDGTSYEEVTHVNRQERVPTLRVTTRKHYQCANCRNTWFKDNLSEVEDFSRREQKEPGQTVVIQREVVKIPCKYCGMLVDPIRDAKCPSCGANLTLVKS
jgi:hypothetical protein